MKIKTLRDYAAEFKWQFQPDDSPDKVGGVVKFENGFLRQRGEGFIVGRVYFLEAPLTEFLSLKEIGALKGLEFGTYLVPTVGKFNATFTLTTQDDVLLSAVRKVLGWCPKTNGNGNGHHVTAPPAPRQNKFQYPAMKGGETLLAYAGRCSMTQEQVLKAIDEIPVEAA
jgi:hypothetical protein